MFAADLPYLCFASLARAAACLPYGMARTLVAALARTLGEVDPTAALACATDAPRTLIASEPAHHVAAMARAG